ELVRRGVPVPRVIFVTAYDEFAVRAFEVRALDYLLKPVEGARCDEALDRAREALARPDADRAGDLERRIRTLLDEYHAASQPRSLPRLLVAIGPRTVPIDTTTIDWIGARDYCAELHVAGKSYVIRETLSTLESRLDPSIFARIHRSAIVNLGRI